MWVKERQIHKLDASQAIRAGEIFPVDEVKIIWKAFTKDDTDAILSTVMDTVKRILRPKTTADDWHYLMHYIMAITPLWKTYPGAFARVQAIAAEYEQSLEMEANILFSATQKLERGDEMCALENMELVRRQDHASVRAVSDIEFVSRMDVDEESYCDAELFKNAELNFDGFLFEADRFCYTGLIFNVAQLLSNEFYEACEAVFADPRFDVSRAPVKTKSRYGNFSASRLIYVVKFYK